MILVPDVAIIFDEITAGKFNIDSYELQEYPHRAQPDLVKAMNLAYDKAMDNHTLLSLYDKLSSAKNEDLFWGLLKEKNEQRRKL